VQRSCYRSLEKFPLLREASVSGWRQMIARCECVRQVELSPLHQGNGGGGCNCGRSTSRATPQCGSNRAQRAENCQGECGDLLLWRVDSSCVHGSFYRSLSVCLCARVRAYRPLCSADRAAAAEAHSVQQLLALWWGRQRYGRAARRSTAAGHRLGAQRHDGASHSELAMAEGRNFQPAGTFAATAFHCLAECIAM
jgi:hypothetical protein